MFGLSAIRELLVRLRLEVLTIATCILLLLSHLSPSLVIGIRPSAFGEKKRSAVIIPLIFRTEQNTGIYDDCYSYPRMLDNSLAAKHNRTAIISTSPIYSSGTSIFHP
jgi:hypothetical protein